MGLVKNCLTARYTSARFITLLKIIQIEPHLNLICVFLWHIYNWNFSKSKGHNSAENYLARPKFKLNLLILLTHLYSEFQFKMSISNGDNEQKLKINGIFLSPRGIILPKIIRPDPNSNSTCLSSWHIYIPNFNSKCQLVMEIMSGNWKLMEFF